MHIVTFMYWYRSQMLGGKTVDFVVAECSRCGLRVGAECPGNNGRKLCADMLRARCRRAEDNTYVRSILECLEDA